MHPWEAKTEEIASMLGTGYLVQTPTQGHIYATATAEKDMEGAGKGAEEGAELSLPG